MGESALKSELMPRHTRRLALTRLRTAAAEREAGQNSRTMERSEGGNALESKPCDRTHVLGGEISAPFKRLPGRGMALSRDTVGHVQ
jgi:hypothetical protein